MPLAAAFAQILVIRGGAIGDFILTLPVLAALRRRYPAARLEVLGHPQIAELAVAGGWAEQAHALESTALAPCFAPGGQPDRATAALFAGCDLIVSYLHDPTAVFQSNLGRYTDARWIVGPHRPQDASTAGESARRTAASGLRRAEMFAPERRATDGAALPTGRRAGRTLHATEVFLEPLEQLGIRGADPVPHLRVPAPPACRALPSTGRWVALHPGSGGESKNWPEPHWAEFLARLVATTDLNLLLVGGEAEGDRLARLAASLPGPRVRRAECWPLVELAGCLEQCVGFVGHDSGISHLAAAVGLPGLILWGETDERVWRPRSKRMRVLREPRGLSALSVDRVVARFAWREPGEGSSVRR